MEYPWSSAKAAVARDQPMTQPTNMAICTKSTIRKSSYSAVVVSFLSLVVVSIDLLFIVGSLDHSRRVVQIRNVFGTDVSSGG